MEDKLTLFRQQAAIIARKKESTAEKLNDVRVELAAIDDEVKEKKSGEKLTFFPPKSASVFLPPTSQADKKQFPRAWVSEFIPLEIVIVVCPTFLCSKTRLIVTNSRP